MKRPPKLPKFVKILGRKYTVAYDPELHCYGQCRMILGEIFINAERCETREMVVKTLWHEIFHGWSWESGLHNFTTVNLEEMICETLANTVYVLTGGAMPKARE